jgi:glycerol-3-phosphate dehydrogenase
MLFDAGIDMEEKKAFQEKRTGWPRFSAAIAEKQEDMIASNSKYGHIICRCEKVSEGEVLEAIHRGVSTLDAVKHVTRAGMGRCQGGFCGPLALGLLSKELSIPVREVTKKGDGSFVTKGPMGERGRNS